MYNAQMYKTKYLKYKSKYLQLKNIQKGGVVGNTIKCVMFPFDKNDRSDVVYDTSTDEVFKKTDNRVEILEKIKKRKNLIFYNINPRNIMQYYNDNSYKVVQIEEFNKVLNDIKNLNTNFVDNGDWYEPNNNNNNNYKPNFYQDRVFAQNLTVENPDAKIIMIGDIHSSLHSLYDIFLKLSDIFEGDTWKLKDDYYMIFLGDIIDRGMYSVELLFIVFQLRINNPNNIFIINGNHENYSMYEKLAGKEWQFQFSHEPIGNLKKQLYYLPSVIYLNFNGKIYHLSHGGIDKDYKTYEIKEFILSDKTFLYINDDKCNGFKWADFGQNNINVRICGGNEIKGFTADTTREYLDFIGAESIISGHQDYISLGLILKNTDNTNINGTDFVYIDQNDQFSQAHAQLDYDLYVPRDDNDYSVFDEERNAEFTIKADDFLALITSTANTSRILLTHNTYLILTKASEEQN